MIYLFYLHSTIRPEYMILFHLFFLLCKTIRPKLRFLITLFLLFIHNDSTKIRDHSYFLIYSFHNCSKISYAIFTARLSLYFVRYIHCSIALIFRTLFSGLQDILIQHMCSLATVAKFCRISLLQNTFG